MSRTTSIVIGLAATFVFLMSAPVAAAAESYAGPELAFAIEQGISFNGAVSLGVAAAVGIGVIALVLMLVSEMISLVRNPIVRSGRRPIRR